jgi:catechol 2,3-dioxygenase-like lactoylglutathione lyase family enzyme
MMAILGMHHVAVSVPNLDEGVAFYCDVLGFKKEQYGPIEPDPIADAMCELPDVAARGWILRHGCGMVEMWEFDSPRAEMPDESRKVNELGYTHFSLMVDDMVATYEELKDKLFFPHPPIQHTVEGDTNNAWTAYCRDPWGNVIELWQLGHEDPFPDGATFDWRPEPLDVGIDKEERYRGDAASALRED